MNLGVIDMNELSYAIKKLKKNVAMDPDKDFAELFQILDQSNREWIVNYCWKHEVVQENMDIAHIVTIFKKGDPSLPSNYRPIALLNMLYKLYTIIIRERIKIADRYIWNTQYGFRENESTQQPLFILRRIMDNYEVAGKPVYITLLDWEKAFDKVNQSD